MADPIQITVTSGSERRTQSEQIDQVLARAQEKHGPLRIRLPFSLYDYDTTRGYVFVRDATWNLQLPSAQATRETIEELIEILGTCIVAIAQEGVETVRKKLERAL